MIRSSNTPPPLRAEHDFWLEVAALAPKVSRPELRSLALGLVRLRAIGEAFEQRRAWLEQETHDARSIYFCVEAAERERLLERRELYLGAHVPFVARTARWSKVMATVDQPVLGRCLDAAIVSVERDNPGLGIGFARDYARPELAGSLPSLVRAVNGISAPTPEATLEVLRAIARVDDEAQPPAPSRATSSALPNSAPSSLPMGKLLERLDDQLRELDRLLRQSQALRAPAKGDE